MIPYFVILELHIRLVELDPLIGEYISHTKISDGMLLKCAGGTIVLPAAILQTQFKNPLLITTQELELLLKGFEWAGGR